MWPFNHLCIGSPSATPPVCASDVFISQVLRHHRRAKSRPKPSRLTPLAVPPHHKPRRSDFVPGGLGPWWAKSAVAPPERFVIIAISPGALTASNSPNAPMGTFEHQLKRIAWGTLPMPTFVPDPADPPNPLRGSLPAVRCKLLPRSALSRTSRRVRLQAWRQRRGRTQREGERAIGPSSRGNEHKPGCVS